MTISTIPPDRRRRAAAFSLTELLIGASLSTVVLAGVLSAFLMLGRSGMNVANYSMAEAEIRRGVEEFSQDARMANGVTWNSSSSVTLTLVAPNAYSGLTSPHTNKVTYAYDNAAAIFYRLPGDATSTAGRSILVRRVSAFNYTRYNRLDALATTDAETKRIQISMNVRRIGATLVATNTTLVMASYILRNKVAN